MIKFRIRQAGTHGLADLGIFCFGGGAGSCSFSLQTRLWVTVAPQPLPFDVVAVFVDAHRAPQLPLLVSVAGAAAVLLAVEAEREDALCRHGRPPLGGDGAAAFLRSSRGGQGGGQGQQVADAPAHGGGGRR